MARLGERLRLLFPHSSERSIKQWLINGRVRINGRVARDPRTPVGDRDRVNLSSSKSSAGAPFPSALTLVYEDGDLIVIDKPPGLLTIATERERERTVYRLLWNYLAGQDPPARPFIVHRLDRETGGLLVFAKSPSAKRHLQAQFEARTTERIYVALVEGRVGDDHGSLESWLTEDRGLRVLTARRRQAGGRPDRRAKQAITHYRVLERGSHSSLVELTLGTGRRRQIRVQLADLGHPIVGDLDYGSRRNPLRRLCLHATRLSFVHPASSTLVRFESPAPASFRRACN